MADNDGHHNPRLADSGVTISSDSELYREAEDDHNGVSPLSSQSQTQARGRAPAVALYQRPTVWSFLRSSAINLLLPFINGMMLGFGELLAHETAFRLGWSGTRIFPASRRAAPSHPIGPGIEIRDRSRQQPSDLNDLLALN